VGSIFADNWADTAGDLKSNDEFAKSFEDYLKNELEFAKHVKINCDERIILLMSKDVQYATVMRY